MKSKITLRNQPDLLKKSRKRGENISELGKAATYEGEVGH